MSTTLDHAAPSIHRAQPRRSRCLGLERRKRLTAVASAWPAPDVIRSWSTGSEKSETIITGHSNLKRADVLVNAFSGRFADWNALRQYKTH